MEELAYEEIERFVGYFAWWWSKYGWSKPSIPDAMSKVYATWKGTFNVQLIEMITAHGVPMRCKAYIQRIGFKEVEFYELENGAMSYEIFD